MDKQQTKDAQQTPPAPSAKKQPTTKAAPEAPKLFVARVSALGATTIRKGEVAVDGASILATHGHLFDPLPITYLA